MAMSQVSAADLQPLLLSTMVVDAGQRRAAEAAVEQLKVVPGFACALCFLVLDASGALELRQLAALVLKQFVRVHWSNDDEADESGDTLTARVTILEGEKATVRAALPSGLRDPVPRIRTAVSMTIAGIAQWDWPESWPTLMRELLAPLEAATSTTAAGVSLLSAEEHAAVAGVLRCLELCAAELQEEHLPDALRSLMPLLLAFVTAPERHARRERARAVRVLHKLLERVATLSDDAVVRHLTRGPLRPWAAAALGVLQSSATDVSNAALADCALELATLRLLRLLIATLPRALDEHADTCLIPPVGALLLRSVRALEIEMRLGQPAGDGEDALLGGGGGGGGGGAFAQPTACDSDGGMLGVASLVSGLLDVLSAIACSSRLSKRMLPALPDVSHAAIALLRINPEAEAEWHDDLAQYIQDEDPDSFAVTPRVASQQLVVEVLDAYGKRGLPPLLHAVSARLEEAAALYTQGSAHWWRLREATLLCLGLAGPVLGRAAAAATAKGDAPLIVPAQLTRDLLLPNAAASCPPLLRARALCTAAKLSPHLPVETLTELLSACRAALAPSEPPQLRISACRAVLDLCEGAPNAALDGAFAELLAPIVALLPLECEDAVLLALDGIAAVLQRNAAIAAAAEAWLAPLLLQLWSARRVEHLTASAVVDCVKALAAAPAALPALVERLLPAIGEVLQLQRAFDAERRAAAAAAPPAVGGAPPNAANARVEDDEGDAVDPLLPALELLEVAFKRWPTLEPLPPAALGGVLPLLLPVLAGTTDGEVLRVGSSCLAKLLRRAPRMADLEQRALDLPSWPQALVRMLRPNMGEELIEGVAPLVGQLAVRIPSFFARHAYELLGALATWLVRARLFGLVQNILVVFSQVVLTPGLGAETLIDSLRRTAAAAEPGSLAAQHACPPAGAAEEAGAGALPLVLRMWVESATDILNPYARKAVLAALCELISPRFPQLCQLPMAADTPPDASAGRVTRGQARRKRQERAAVEQTVPVLVRVFALSVRTYHVVAAGAVSGGAGGANARTRRAHYEEDEEEDDEDDYDEDGEDEEEGGGAEEAEEAAAQRRDGRRPSPFVAADSVAFHPSVVNLSDLLADDDDSDDDEEEEEEADDADDPVRSLELSGRLAAYLSALQQALGEQQFGGLCNTLPGVDERRAVVHALGGGAGSGLG